MRLFFGIILVLVLADLCAVVLAKAEDFRSCREAYEFCGRRPFHRECVVWTTWGRPLVVTRVRPRNVAIDLEYCRANPWHASCGQGGGTYSVECPLP